MAKAISIQERNDFINKFHEATQAYPPKPKHHPRNHAYLMKNHGENSYSTVKFKPADFKTAQMANVAKDCLNSLKEDHTTPSLHERIQLISKLNSSLQQLSNHIENSIKNRWWYCILHFFGYQAQCPDNVKNLELETKNLLLELQKHQIPEKNKKAVEDNPKIDKAAPVEILPALDEGMKPYTLEISFRGKPEKEIHEVKNALEEEALIKVISEYVNKTHKVVTVKNLPKNSEETFKKFFELVVREDSIKILPKIAKKEPLEEKKLKITYENGVIEEFQAVEDAPSFAKGVRYYPDGTTENGMFIIGDGFNSNHLHEGYCLRNGEYTFYKPKFLGFKDIHQEYNFVEMEIGGFKQVFFVQKTEELFKHILFKGTQYEMFWRFSQMDNFVDVLSHPNCPIYIREFIKFLFLPCPALKDHVTPIFTLNITNTEYILNMIKEHKVYVDFHKVDPVFDDTLFTKWVRKGDSANVIQAILKLDPTVIQQVKDKKFIEHALLHGEEKVANILDLAMLKANIPHSEEARWLMSIALKVNGFTDDEFIKLDPKIKEHIYQVANVFGYDDIVLRLNQLGMENDHPQALKGPFIVASNMDVARTRKTLEDYLKKLRRDKLLLNAKEFDELFVYKSDLRDLGFELSDILARDYIEREVKELGLKYIKIPKYFAVVEDNLESISMTLNRNTLEPKSDDIKIYREQVKDRVDRKLAREEMSELINLLGKTNFSNMDQENFIISEDGVYFINTKFDNFSNEPNYDGMHSLDFMLAKEDQDWFHQLIIDKIKNKQKIDLGQRENQNKVNLKKYGFKYRRQPFTFETNQIFA